MEISSRVRGLVAFKKTICQTLFLLNYAQLHSIVTNLITCNIYSWEIMCQFRVQFILILNEEECSLYWSFCFVTFSFQVKQIVDEILEKLPEEFNMTEIMGKVEERTPYVIVAFQECQRMNHLTGEMKRSLRELDLGLKVQPQICTHISTSLTVFYNAIQHLLMSISHE